jgi:hypothetical protein
MWWAVTSWVTNGWKRLQVMLERQGLRVHPSSRWYEETLEPSTSGRTRIDPYVQIETQATSPSKRSCAN